MNLKELPFLEKIYWKDVREKVAKLQPEFARLIDELDLGKKFPLYLARYKYGDRIIEKGHTNIPNENGQMVGLDDLELKGSIREDLGYGNPNYMLPMGMVLQHAVEIGMTPQNLVLPSHFYNPGAIFALWAHLDSVNSFYHPFHIFTLTAGARSIFTLPRIGGNNLHKKLPRKLPRRSLVSKSLSNQHEIFVDIVRQVDPNNSWYVELLFFSKKWMQQLKSDDVAWLKVQRFLFKFIWEKTAYWRNKVYYDFAFSCAQANRNLKPNPYLADTFKYILVMACGHMPGFVPATDEVAAPVKLLQEFFLDSYGMKQYVPTIMHPGYFRKDPIYYSLSFPIATEFSPRSRKDVVALQDLRELKHIKERFFHEVLAGKLGLEYSTMDFMVRNVDLEFCHNKPDRFEEVELAKNIINKDLRFENCLVPCRNKEIAINSPFVSGCVKISKKDSTVDNSKE